MDDAVSPNGDPDEVGGADEDVDVADVSGGAVPEQMLEDPADVTDATPDVPD